MGKDEKLNVFSCVCVHGCVWVYNPWPNTTKAKREEVAASTFVCGARN